MRRLPVSLLTFSLLVVTGPNPARSADDSDDTTRNGGVVERLENLEEAVVGQDRELGELHRGADQVQPDPKMGSERNRYNPSRGWLANYGGFPVDVDIHGFLNLEYIDPQKEGEREGKSTFDLHHANIFLDVFLRSNLRSHVEVEFEHAFEDVEIDQAYMEWGIKPWLTVTAGRFYAPIGIERFAWYPMANALVSRPAASRDIIPDNEIASLSAKRASMVFLKQLRTWEDGSEIEPVDQHAGSRTRALLSEFLHGRSISAIKSHWHKQIFTGRGLPPLELQSDQDVIDFVRSHRYAIGYVSSSAPIGDLKIVRIDP